MKRYAIFIVSCMLLPQLAQAEIEGVTYKDTYNQTVDKTIADGDYINPASGTSLTFTISAGLDNTLRLTLSDGTTDIASVSSSVISVSDRLSYHGNDFYGKQLTLNSPSVDGNYTVKAEVINTSGTVVGQWQKTFGRDTTPPTGDASKLAYAIKGYTYGSLHTYAPSYFGTLSITGLSDTGSGLSYANYIIKDQSDAVVGYVKAPLDTISGSIAMNSLPANIVPANKVTWNAGYRVYDKAGNYTDLVTDTLIDLGGYSAVEREVYNASTGIWEPYTAGMTIYANPVKIRYKRSFNETKEYNGTWGWPTYGYREGAYVYDERTFTYPGSGSNYLVFQAISGVNQTVYDSTFTFTLAAGVGRAPFMPSTTMDWWDSTGTVTGHSTLRTKDPLTVTRLRLYSEAMDYEQLANLQGVGSCVIPIGATYCETATNLSFSSGHNYVPYNYFVSSSVNGVADGRYSTRFQYLYTYWDFEAPTIEKIVTDDSSVTAYVYDTDTTSDWRASLWTTSVFRLKSSLGSEITPSSVVNSGTGKFEVTFQLNKLPEGIQNVSFYTDDSYGNRAEQLIFSGYNNDTTPPVIATTLADGSVLHDGDTLNGLDSLRVKITDSSQTTINSVVLTGGAANDTVNVATTALGSGVYSLLYPRIFPSLEAGQDYTVTITATDVANNAAQHQLTFLYVPPNLLQAGGVQTLAINRQINDTNDSPISAIHTGVLRAVDGTLASGPQTAYITLRSDAKFSAMIAGTVIAPGETKTVVLTPLVTGELVIPVYSNQAGDIGSADFMIDIPEITHL